MTPEKIARDMLEAIIYDNDMANREEPIEGSRIAPWLERVVNALKKPVRELGLNYFTGEWIEEFCCGENSFIDDEVKAHPCLGELNDVLNDFFDEY